MCFSGRFRRSENPPDATSHDTGHWDRVVGESVESPRVLGHDVDAAVGCGVVEAHHELPAGVECGVWIKEQHEQDVVSIARPEIPR